jgi:hypothetical protein
MSSSTYCYIRIPKGLRNAGPTFCRMMKAVLKDQVGRNIFSYVDDIMVASKKKASYITYKKRSTETGMSYRSTEQVYTEASKEKFAFF